MKFKRLFSSGTIGTLSLKNRLVMPAMGVGLANMDGTVSDAMLAYYEERAMGGVGLIITEVTMVNGVHGRHNPHQLGAFDDLHIDGLGKLASILHQHGTKIFIQLYHPGNQTLCSLIGNQSVLTPSGVMSQVLHQQARAMTVKEIKSLVSEFADAAVRAKQAGIDGVELHAAHGYLLNEFISPYTNKRTDEYGGSTENRARIIKEIIFAIRERVGRNFPVILRISVDEFLDRTKIDEDGLVLKDGLKTLAYLEQFGIDAVSVSSGIYDSQNMAWEPMSYEQGHRLYLAEAVKKVVSIPVIAVSVIREPTFAEKALEKGSTDFIGVARGQLADPQWGLKAFEGREDEIRKCISCLHCMEMLSSTHRTECGLNARSHHELEYGELEENGNGRPVAIIGAGPAGMEATRVLALRKFHPVIFEKTNAIGGQLNIACKPPHKKKIRWVVDYYKRQFELLNIPIRLHTAPSIEELKELAPCAVFVATGAVPIVPKAIPGIAADHVFTSFQILNEEHKLNQKRVAVIGSGATGLEIAEFLAVQGNTVTIIEMCEEIGPSVYFQNLVDVTVRLKKLGVVFLPGHQLVEIKTNSVLLESCSKQTIIEQPADCVVLALGVSSNNTVKPDISKHFKNVQFIGDVQKPGRIANAVRTGYVAAASLFCGKE
ncbi:MAG: FAD-dependent oxidoreductase [Desulfobacteraceae bacterium]|jgi:2,4-dienoyl-CoA reductase-like NADH-dependent reductase (Old Yellow Enzyme family)/thioredoxin reductase